MAEWDPMSTSREDRRLLRFLARHCLGGIATGWLLLVGLVASNVGGLWQLILGNGIEVTALLLLAAGFAVTFGSLAMGTAIFLLPRD